MTTTTYLKRDIRMQAIDSEGIGDVEDNVEAVTFNIKLTDTPAATWAHEFDQVYKQVAAPLKPPVHVIGDSLQVTYLPRYANELPEILHLLAHCIARANEETHISEQIHGATHQDREREEFRVALRKLKLPG